MMVETCEQMRLHWNSVASSFVMTYMRCYDNIPIAMDTLIWLPVVNYVYRCWESRVPRNAIATEDRDGLGVG